METEQLCLVDLINDMCAGNDVTFQPLRVAGDIMDKEVRTLTLDHTVNACIKLMKDLEIRHLPLVDIPCTRDAKPYFVGIVSERDVLRLISPSVKKKGEKEIDKQALRQLLAQIVVRKPESVSPDTPIIEVLMIMLDNHIDMVPVLDEAGLVCIITTVNILKIFSRIDEVVHQLYPDLNKTGQPGDLAPAESNDANALSSWTSQTVRDVMTKKVVSLLPYDKLAAAIDLMQEHECRHVPVTNEEGKLLGIISDRDILRHLHYTGKRAIGMQKGFRDHLFKTDADFVNLEMTLINIMSLRITYVLPDINICDAVKTLHKLKLSCLPVVDEQKKLLGILTMTDLMSELLTIYGGRN